MGGVSKVLNPNSSCGWQRGFVKTESAGLGAAFSSSFHSQPSILSPSHHLPVPSRHLLQESGTCTSRPTGRLSLRGRTGFRQACVDVNLLKSLFMITYLMPCYGLKGFEEDSVTVHKHVFPPNETCSFSLTSCSATQWKVRALG